MFIGYVTDLRRTEAIDQSVRSMRSIFASCPIGVVTINSEGVMVEVNRALLRDFGYEKEEDLVHRNVKVLMPAETAAKHDSYLERYYRTGVKHILDSTRQVFAVKRDGTRFPLEISVFQVKKRNPLSATPDTYFTGYVRSIAPERRLERQLTSNDTIIDKSDAAMVKISRRGIVQQFNEAAEEVFERRADTVLGRNIATLMPARDGRLHDNYMRRYHTTGVSHIIGCTRIVTALKRVPKVLPPLDREGEEGEGDIGDEFDDDDDDEFTHQGLTQEMNDDLALFEEEEEEEARGRFELELRVLEVPDGYVAYIRDVSSSDQRVKFVREVIEKSFPKAYRERLSRGERIHDLHPKISVLFMDLVHFTRLSRDQKPETVVTFLDDLFSAFDGFLSHFKAHKIKTIGDCYVLVTNLQGDDARHADNAVSAALEMIRIVRQFDAKHILGANTGLHLRCRVGIHSGEALSGVIGLTKPALDVWGEAAIFANELESSGIPGQVQISLETYSDLSEELKPHFKERLFTPTSRGAVTTRITFLDDEDAEPLTRGLSTLTNGDNSHSRFFT